jgi:hypothetical protein
VAEGPIDLLIELAALLERLEIPYALGGSLASSLLGEPRTTVDIDLAVQLRAEAIAALVRELGSSFYVDEEAALDAVRRNASFNAVHLESVQKVDFFVLGDTLLDRRQVERRCRIVVSEDPRRELWVTSAEDQVLRKLDWYRAGDGISDRQWRDVVGILAVQADRLDWADLRTTAAELQLGDLLTRAIRDAGFE